MLVVAGVSLFVLPILAWNGLLPKSLSFRDLIDTLKLFVSWPVAVVAVAYGFMGKFHSALDSYLRSIGLMKLPGGVEIQTDQRASNEAKPSESPANLVLTPEQEDQLNKIMSSLESANLSVEEKNVLEQKFDDMARIAMHWKFSFLNQFFVQNTRNVLHWFSYVQPQSRANYSTLWQSAIPDEEQRQLILNTLLHFGLLTELDGLIRITEQGYSFLQFIGMIPPTPA